MNQNFSLTKEEREAVDQKLKELLYLCQTLRVPMFATVAIENTQTGTRYNNITLGPAANHIPLTDDRIRHHTLIAAGFSAMPARNDITLNTLLEGGDS